MTAIKLLINGVPVDWGKAWVHLQDPDVRLASSYVATVPLDFAGDVFDPHGTKAEQTSWEEHIQAHVDEFGTFHVEGYFENMSTLSGGPKESGYEWVIATVDDVTENIAAIVLSGKVVRFRR